MHISLKIPNSIVGKVNRRLPSRETSVLGCFESGISVIDRNKYIREYKVNRQLPNKLESLVSSLALYSL